MSSAKAAFYQKSINVKTSIEIINEARASLRFVETTRPCTPLDTGLSERLSSANLAKRITVQSKSPSQIPKLKPIKDNAVSLRRKSGSLQDLSSIGSVDNSRRIHSGSSCKSPNVDKDAGSSRNGWNPESLSTMLGLLEEFIAHSDILFEDEKALESLVETVSKFELPSDDRFIQLRTELLRCIFTSLQRRDKLSSKQNLILIQLALALGVTDSNMINMCKLMYKICRAMENKDLFLNGANHKLPTVLLNVINTLITEKRANERNSYEPVIHCLACLKFVSSNETGARYLLECGAVEVITNKIFIALSVVNLSDETAQEQQAKVAEVCLQLMGVLRNLSEDLLANDSFRKSNTFAAIFDTMICFNSNSDVILMCARILSKTSLDAECCSNIIDTLRKTDDDDFDNQTSVFYFFSNMMLQHCENENISVRLAFTVGNIVTECMDCVHQIIVSPASGEMPLNNFLVVFSAYLVKVSDKASNDSLEVVTKTARLLANAAADEQVGEAMAMSSDFIECAIKCLGLVQNKSSKQNSIHDNLMAAVLAALNNISYYALSNLGTGEEVLLWNQRLEFANSLIPFFMLDHRSNLLIEALHVMANFSQFVDVRQALLDFKIPELCLTFLDANSMKLSFVCCGILVNFSIDPSSRQLLIDAGCLEKVHDTIIAFANPQWLISPNSTNSFYLPLVDVCTKLLLNLCGTLKLQAQIYQDIVTKLKVAFAFICDNLVIDEKLMEDEDVLKLTQTLLPLLVSRFDEMISHKE